MTPAKGVLIALTHGVDRVLEDKSLSLDIDCNLLTKIAVRDSSAHRRNVTHLFRVSDRHCVEIADKLLPDTALVFHGRLDAQLALDTLCCNPDDLLREIGQLGDHLIDGRIQG